MAEQRRKLPPMVNDRSLFTKAAPFGNKEDPFYHSPSNRIANNYSPSSMRAASVLFEEFPSVRGAGMGRAAAAGDVQGRRGRIQGVALARLFRGVRVAGHRWS